LRGFIEPVNIPSRELQIMPEKTRKNFSDKPSFFSMELAFSK